MMLINTKYLQANVELTCGWVRLFGYGIAYKNTKHHPSLFSERNKYTKTLKIGIILFTLLTDKLMVNHNAH